MSGAADRALWSGLATLLVLGLCAPQASGQALPRVSMVLTLTNPSSAGGTAITENGSVTVTATMDKAATNTVTVTIAVTPHNQFATDFATTDDFTVSENKELTFAAGDTSSTGVVTISAVDDGGIKKRQRRIRVTITPSSNAVTAPFGHQSSFQDFYIIDDDPSPTKSVVVTPTRVSEQGGQATVTAVLSHATDFGNVLLDVETELLPAGSPDRAEETDFAMSDNVRLVIPKGETESTGTVTITAADNDVTEPPLKRLQVYVHNVDRTNVQTEPGLYSLSVDLVIQDDDTPPQDDDTPPQDDDTPPQDDDTNGAPAFHASEYAFELRENIDGSRQPVDLGAVAASDPDGDEVTYELAVGDRGRFAVGRRDGMVRYVGPGEYFESEPNRYRLSVRARDPHGAAVTARVVVTIVNVNELPEAKDDEAVTDEDQAVTVDVLANDTDPDGDRLRVESVSAAGHGTTAVVEGGVRYAPEANYHGMDRFSYVVSDGNGATATAAVEVTVVPVNDAPVAVGVMADQALDEGGEETTVELEPFFEDIDGDALTYGARSSDPSVAAAMVSGAVLTLTPIEYGSAAVTVTAEDAGGLTATQTFAVGVSDRLVRGVLFDTLAALARSHLASARMTLGRRLRAGAREESRLTVMGRQVPLGAAAARATAEQMLAGWLSSATWTGTSTHGRPGSYGPAGVRPALWALPGGGPGEPATGRPAPVGMPSVSAGGLYALEDSEAVRTRCCTAVHSSWRWAAMRTSGTPAGEGWRCGVKATSRLSAAPLRCSGTTPATTATCEPPTWAWMRRCRSAGWQVWRWRVAAAGVTGRWAPSAGGCGRVSRCCTRTYSGRMGRWPCRRWQAVGGATRTTCGRRPVGWALPNSVSVSDWSRCGAGSDRRAAVRRSRCGPTPRGPSFGPARAASLSTVSRRRSISSGSAWRCRDRSGLLDYRCSRSARRTCGATAGQAREGRVWRWQSGCGPKAASSVSMRRAGRWRCIPRPATGSGARE